jgi:hypothetical protein
MSVAGAGSMSGLITIACVLSGVVIGWFAGYYQDHRREQRRLPPPPIDPDDLERLEPHHSVSCNFVGGIWRCGTYCEANAWRKKNAGRPIVRPELPRAKVVQDMNGAVVVKLGRRK